MLGILAVFAQLEAEHASERVRSGLQAVKARGKRGGRPRAVVPALKTEIRSKLENGAPTEQLARDYEIDAATVRRIRRRD